MRKSRKSIVIAGTVTGVLVGGAAFAYWTTSGDGTGSASTSAGAASLVVTQTGTISNMYPGDSAQTITGNIKNNAANSAYVTQVVASITGVTGPNIDATHPCSASDYTLAGATMPVGVDIVSGGNQAFSGATIKFNNTGGNQDGCKGATVALAFAAS